MKSGSRWLSEARATPPDSDAPGHPHPGGMKSGSRWLSEATPPDSDAPRFPHPGGMPARTGGRAPDGTPAGVRNFEGRRSGGVAPVALNHRLPDGMPPASGTGEQPLASPRVPTVCGNALIQAEKLRICSSKPSDSASRSRHVPDGRILTATADFGTGKCGGRGRFLSAVNVGRLKTARHKTQDEEGASAVAFLGRWGAHGAWRATLSV
jgi:hypothetical protein